MHSFTPFWGVAFPDWQDAEKAFFRSLKNLCDFKGWTAPDNQGLPFPQNVSAIMKALPLNAGEGENVLLLNEREHPLALATVTTFDTGFRLYYIPVRPLFKMSQIPEMSAHYALVKGLFAYLYNVVGVPYFREPGYLDNTYDTLENWIGESDDEDDNEFRQRQKDEMEAMRFGGDYLLPLIQQACSLAQLNEQITKFLPADKYDDSLKEVAVEIWKLYKDYPTRKIKDNMHYEFAETGDNDLIYWENYLSFYWSGEDCLQENIYDMVNSELQELGYQEEPVAIQWFDTPQEKPQQDFDFEARFFALLNRLTELLNDFDHEELNQ